MSRYTGNGDRGTTSLVRMKNVSKSDDRIQLIGTIEELSAHLGLLKTEFSDQLLVQKLEDIQSILRTVSAGVSDPYSKDGKIHSEALENLGRSLQELEERFEYPVSEELPGKSRLSAEIDIAVSVARRAERTLAAVGVKFGADTGAKRYMNCLGDFLYALARAVDAGVYGTGQKSAEVRKNDAVLREERSEIQADANTVNEQIVREVLKQMGIQGRITLDAAKRLIEKIEEEAKRRGKQAVIAVCGPDGNPIAVHVMDGAFLVSFDVAVKKAYTSVAVKMSTMELNALAQPGATFYGLDKIEGANIVIFGGGVPIKAGDTIIGGLGISGGTGEEDHALAEYGLSILNEIL